MEINLDQSKSTTSSVISLIASWPGEFAVLLSLACLVLVTWIWWRVNREPGGKITLSEEELIIQLYSFVTVLMSQHLKRYGKEWKQAEPGSLDFTSATIRIGEQTLVVKLPLDRTSFVTSVRSTFPMCRIKPITKKEFERLRSSAPSKLDTQIFII